MGCGQDDGREEDIYSYILFHTVAMHETCGFRKFDLNR